MRQERPIVRDDHPEDRKKSFTELFTTREIVYNLVAVLVFIVLGLLFTNRFLNFVVGPLFFIGWMWVVPPMWERWRSR